jgi:hypothetical protein
MLGSVPDFASRPVIRQQDEQTHGARAFRDTDRAFLLGRSSIGAEHGRRHSDRNRV